MKKTQGKSCLSLLHTSNHCLLSHLSSRERDLHTGRQERGGGRREERKREEKQQRKGKKKLCEGAVINKEEERAMTERSLINARYRYFCSALTLGLRRDHALQHPNSFQKVNRGGKSSDKSSKSPHPEVYTNDIHVSIQPFQQTLLSRVTFLHAIHLYSWMFTKDIRAKRLAGGYDGCAPSGNCTRRPRVRRPVP